MGDKLSQYYDFVKQRLGMDGQMRLAMKTGMTSMAAKNKPDTPELIAKFKEAIKEITGQFPPN